MNKITLGIVAAVFSTSANASWSIVDLGESLYATAINDLGQITGSSSMDYSKPGQAFITDANGLNLRNIDSIETGSFAFGINNTGQVVGQYVDTNGDYRSFVTGPNGNGINDPGTQVSFNGINDDGQVVGSFLVNGVEHSFISDDGGATANDIGTLAGLHTFATSINNSGQVVGHSRGDDGKNHAFITGDDGIGMKDIGSLDPKYYKTTIAHDINESGQVVGFSSMDNKTWSHAFITGADGEGMINLGTLGTHSSVAVAINDAGQAVGLSYDVGTDLDTSFIYANGGLTNLSALPEVIVAGWKDIIVTDINNNGQIVGYGNLNNEQHSFMLSFTSDTVFTPEDFHIPLVPEPSTYLMLLAGLGLLGFVGRVKNYC